MAEVTAEEVTEPTTPPVPVAQRPLVGAVPPATAGKVTVPELSTNCAVQPEDAVFAPEAVIVQEPPAPTPREVYVIAQVAPLVKLRELAP